MISVSFAFFHVETFYGKFELKVNLYKSKFMCSCGVERRVRMLRQAFYI